jgi:hypothetical protein
MPKYRDYRAFQKDRDVIGNIGPFADLHRTIVG